MQRIGFQRLAVVLVGDAPQRARAPPVHAHGKQHHGESGDGRLNVDATKKQPQTRFVDNPGAGEQQKPGLDKRGKILDLAVTILVVGIGRLVGDADGEKCQQRKRSDRARSAPLRTECPGCRSSRPTAIFSPVMTTAANTEFPAAERFSARINSGGGTAGLPDMVALSPVHRDATSKARTHDKPALHPACQPSPVRGAVRASYGPSAS